MDEQDGDRRPAYPGLADHLARSTPGERRVWQRKWRYAAGQARRLRQRHDAHRPRYAVPVGEGDYVEVLLAAAIEGGTFDLGGGRLSRPSLAGVLFVLAGVDGPLLIGPPPAAVDWDVWAVAETRCWHSCTGLGQDRESATWHERQDREDQAVARWRRSAYAVAASLMLDAVRAGYATCDTAQASFALDGALSVEIDVDADPAQARGGRPDPTLSPVQAGQLARGHLARVGHTRREHLGGQGTWAAAPEHLGYARRLLAPHRPFADLTWTAVEHALLTYDQDQTAAGAQALAEQIGQVTADLTQPGRRPDPTPPLTRGTP
jgi:hypothetical protein